MAASTFALLALANAGNCAALSSWDLHNNEQESSRRELRGFASVIEADRTVEAFDNVTGPFQEWVQQGQKRLTTFLEKSVEEPTPAHAKLSEVSLKKMSLVTALELAISMLLWLIIVVLAAYYYERTILPDMVTGAEIDPKVDAPTFHDFDSGLFNCLDDTPVCLWSTLFPSVLWASNVSISGHSGFWPAVIFFCVLHIASSWASHLVLGVLVWAILCAVCAYYRHKMRYTYRMEEQGLAAYSKDCVAYLCCTCCAISQEARHLQVATNKLKKANLQANAQLD